MPDSSTVAWPIMPMPLRTILREPSALAPEHVTTCHHGRSLRPEQTIRIVALRQRHTACVTGSWQPLWAVKDSQG